MKTTYETIQAHDGAALRTAKFEPNTPPVGVIQLIHGFGEHIGNYETTAAYFTDRGYSFIIHDQRGFGEMPGKTAEERKSAQGIIPGYDYLFQDIQTIREKIALWYPGLPVFLCGFSMGGNIAVNYFLKYPEAEAQYKKLILIAPWFRLCKPKPAILTVLARFLGKCNQKLRQETGLRTKYITRDTAEAQKIEDDEIFHQTMSFRLYAESVDGGEHAIQNAAKLTLSTLLLSAGEDKIVSPKAIRAFAENAKSNVTLQEYPGAYHALHLDIIKDEVLGHIIDFCKNEKGVYAVT